MKHTKRNQSTFDRVMKSSARRRRFLKKYKTFVVSEFIRAVMENEKVSVRKLAREVGISPRVVQELQSGKRTNVTLRNFFAILAALGCDVAVVKDGEFLVLKDAA